MLLREYREELERKYVLLERGGIIKLVRRYRIGPFVFHKNISRTFDDCEYIRTSTATSARYQYIKAELMEYEDKLNFTTDHWKEVE